MLYNLNVNQFTYPQQVTNLGPGTGLRPKIVTSTNKAHVIFLRTDISPSRASTRDADLSTNPPTWESSYENIAIAEHASDGIWYQSIVRRGDTLHVVSYEYVSGGPHYMHASKRYVNDNSWPSSTDLGPYSFLNFDGKRSLVVLADTIYGLYPTWTGSQLNLLIYKPSTGWSTSDLIERERTLWIPDCFIIKDRCVLLLAPQQLCLSVDQEKSVSPQRVGHDTDVLDRPQLGYR